MTKLLKYFKDKDVVVEYTIVTEEENTLKSLREQKAVEAKGMNDL